jgi:hypothetical protein
MYLPFGDQSALSPATPSGVIVPVARSVTPSICVVT